jgi:hypothetical protein
MQNFGKILQYFCRFDKKLSKLRKFAENSPNLAKFRRKKKNSQTCQRNLAKLRSPFRISPRDRLQIQEDP